MPNSDPGPFEKKLWPDGKIFALTLGVDDVHPESSHDDEGIDYGGDMDDGNFGQLTKLVHEITELKITLFVTPAWTMRPDYFTGQLKSILNLIRGKKSYPETAFRLDAAENSGWSSWLTQKVAEGNFEVAPHGLTHFNGNAGFAGLEFFRLTKEESVRRIAQAEEVFANAKIPFVKGFRQPGWYWSKELLDSLEVLGYSYFAGSGDMEEAISETARSRRVGYPGVSLIYPDRIPSYSFVTFATNAREGEYGRALSVAGRGGLVFLHTHIGPSAYGVRHLNANSARNFAEMIKKLSIACNNRVWFPRLSEIAYRYRLIEKIFVRCERDQSNACILEITNSNDVAMDGLTLGAPDIDLAGVAVDTENILIHSDALIIPHLEAEQKMRVKLRL